MIAQHFNVQIPKNPSASKRSDLHATLTETEITQENLQFNFNLLSSESEEDQTKGIEFFSSHPTTLNSNILAAIFEIGSRGDEEMNLVILEYFFPSILKNNDVDLNLFKECGVLDFLSQYISEDAYLYTLALHIIKILCEKCESIKEDILSSSIFEETMTLAESKIEELSDTQIDEHDDDFTQNVYLIEGAFHLANVFLPDYADETATLINALLQSPRQTLLSLGFDCLHIWLQKCESDSFSQLINEEFVPIFHNFLLTSQNDALIAVLYIIDDCLKKDAEYSDYFIEYGFQEFLLNYSGRKSNEICLILSILCSMAPHESDDVNNLIFNQKVVDLVNYANENETYNIYQYALIFIINLVERENFDIYQFVFENYPLILTKMISVLDIGKCAIAVGIMKCFYRLFAWILRKNDQEKASYFEILDPEKVCNSLDGLLEIDMPQEFVDIATQLRDALDENTQK